MTLTTPQTANLIQQWAEASERCIKDDWCARWYVEVQGDHHTLLVKTFGQEEWRYDPVVLLAAIAEAEGHELEGLVRKKLRSLTDESDEE